MLETNFLESIRNGEYLASPGAAFVVADVVVTGRKYQSFESPETLKQVLANLERQISHFPLLRNLVVEERSRNNFAGEFYNVKYLSLTKSCGCDKRKKIEYNLTCAPVVGFFYGLREPFERCLTVHAEMRKICTTVKTTRKLSTTYMEMMSSFWRALVK